MKVINIAFQVDFSCFYAFFRIKSVFFLRKYSFTLRNYSLTSEECVFDSPLWFRYVAFYLFILWACIILNDVYQLCIVVSSTSTTSLLAELQNLRFMYGIWTTQRNPWPPEQSHRSVRNKNVFFHKYPEFLIRIGNSLNMFIIH